MLLQNPDISIDKLENDLLSQKRISLSILRLDKIHPVVSGNKLFKLHFFLEEARLQSLSTVVTFGGAFSNHLVATAYACKLAGFKTVGFVRGEQPKQLSHTLIHCLEYGMELIFLSREDYAQKDNPDFIRTFMNTADNYISIPEGGFGPQGAKGAALIMDYPDDSATHICTAVGTATTLAGLLMGTKEHQQVIGIPVLKGMEDLEARIALLTGEKKMAGKLSIMKEFHFGGYAKKTPVLLNFMNGLYQQFHLPTDFVYTAKMMYGIWESINQDYFPEGSNIICVHTGGLQGNLSLPVGSLTFK